MSVNIKSGPTRTRDIHSLQRMHCTGFVFRSKGRRS